MQISVSIDAAGQIARFERLGTRVPTRVGSAVRHWGALLQARVKAHAAGRPGPRMVTGDYSRSIALDVSMSGAATEARVGTNRPQGRRLELGWHGVDALGRHANQPPYPHFMPAFNETAPEFVRALGDVLDEEDI